MDEVSRSQRIILSNLQITTQKRLSRKYGIHIQPKTKIGKGLYIGHGYIIVNSTAVIGDNCNLSQFHRI